MIRQDNKPIIKDFLNKRGLSSDLLSSALKKTIVAISNPFFLLGENMIASGVENSSDPVDGLLITTTMREFNTVTGSLALIAIGHLQESEVLARSIVEGVTNTLYIISKDPVDEFLKFFHTYIKTERNHNELWKKSVENINVKEKTAHLKRIAKKDKALDEYESFLNIFSRHIGGIYPPTDEWCSNLYERFKTIGSEVEYRTIYAALCSQSHHDAEDILNKFIVGTAPESVNLSNRLEDETNMFSIFMALFGCRFFIRLVKSLGERYKLKSVILEAERSHKKITRELELVARCLDSGTFAKNWRSDRNPIGDTR